jgi:hypothetical protein
MVVCCECSKFLKMNPNIAMLYENTLLKYYAMKKQKMSNKKKLKRKSTNPIYLGVF